MKILLVHYEWPGVTDCGGSGRVAQLLRDRLQKRGHTIPLVTDRADGHYLTFPLRRRFAIVRALKEHNPDILFSGSTLPTAFGLGSLCDRYDVPLVVKTMGSDVYNPERFNRIRPLLNRVNRRIFDAASSIIVQSRAMADYIPNDFQRDIVRIPNGLTAEKWAWKQRKPHSPLRVLTVARVEPVKRIGAGIQACQELREQGRSIRYRIVGAGSQLPSLRDRYDDLEWVEFTGWAEDVSAHYDWGDIFLLPSAHESFGMVLLEAIATGMPVVTTDTGGQTDILKPGLVAESPVGYLSESEPQALAEGLETVWSKYQTYQANTRAYVSKHFSLADVVDEYESVFAELPGTSPPRSITDERQDERETSTSHPSADIPNVELD